MAGNSRTLSIFATQWHALRLYRRSVRYDAKGQSRRAIFCLQLAKVISTIEIAHGAVIGDGTVFVHGNGIVIGPGSVVGRHCSIFHQVTIGSQDGESYPTVGDHVVIYPGAKVIGNITIGDGARIGANAVVLRDVPAGATAVGNPAVIIDESHSRD
jgi:serine O-acetyltransferase